MSATTTPERERWFRDILGSSKSAGFEYAGLVQKSGLGTMPNAQKERNPMRSSKLLQRRTKRFSTFPGGLGREIRYCL